MARLALSNTRPGLKRPLISVSYHDELTASDLVGSFLISGGATPWVDGPLACAVRDGAICYLDELVEAPPALCGAGV